MKSNFVFTLTGPDRIGIVDEVTELLLDLGGNVETSRMSRLGGAFAMLVLICLPAERVARLEGGISALIARGYKVTVSPADFGDTEGRSAWPSYRIEVRGADHEGIIHEIAHSIARRGINIESMETETAPAPISGAPLFTMTARIAAPPGLAQQDWEAELNDAGRRLNVEIEVSPSGRG